MLTQSLLLPDLALDVPPDEAEERAAPPGKRWRSGGVTAPILRYIRDELPASPSTAAYLIFCTPDRVYSLEKDHGAGAMAESDPFLTTYNHDRADESNAAHLHAAAHDLSEVATGMDIIVGCSIQRKQTVDGYWRRAVREASKTAKTPRADTSTRQTLKLPVPRPTFKWVVDMILDPEISNDETHFAVVLDSVEGRVLWRRVFAEGERVSAGDET